MMRLYIASKTKHGPRWMEWSRKNPAVASVVSSWMRESGPGMTKSRPELADRCLREAAAADRLIVYCEPGEVLEGALVEAGACLLAGGEVVLVGAASLGGVISEHPRVRRAETFDQAVAMQVL